MRRTKLDLLEHEVGASTTAAALCPLRPRVRFLGINQIMLQSASYGPYPEAQYRLIAPIGLAVQRGNVRLPNLQVLNAFLPVSPWSPGLRRDSAGGCRQSPRPIVEQLAPVYHEENRWSRDLLARPGIRISVAASTNHRCSSRVRFDGQHQIRSIPMVGCEQPPLSARTVVPWRWIHSSTARC